MKRLSFLFVFLTFATVVSAQFRPMQKRRHNVNKALKHIVSAPDFKTAGFAFLAIDVNSGEIISACHADKVLRPASTLKLLTTATALELLHPQYRFTTMLGYTGKIDTIQHILHGNIVIKGGGDPTPGSKYFNETKSKQFLNKWKEAVKRLGIDSITGSIITDARIYSYKMVPSSWSWQNMGNYFGAGPCGLTIEDNTYSIYFNTGSRVGDTVALKKTEPTMPNLIIKNYVRADSINYDNSYIFGAPYCNRRTIRGQLPVGRNFFRVKGSMPDPAFIAAWQLDSTLNSNGIKTGKKPTTVRMLKEKGHPDFSQVTLFDTLFSPPLSEIITQTNTHSINLFAEHCALAAGMTLGAAPQTETAMDSIVSFWDNKGMNIQGMQLTDGSGLSQYDAISPRQMVFILSYMKKHSRWFNVFYNSLAIGGETGTLEDMFYNTTARGNIRAKSGTIDGVKAYAGYVTTKSGREVAFSMVVNNFSCSSHEAKSKMEYLMTALSAFNR